MDGATAYSAIEISVYLFYFIIMCIEKRVAKDHLHESVVQEHKDVVLWFKCIREEPLVASVDTKHDSVCGDTFCATDTKRTTRMCSLK